MMGICLFYVSLGPLWKLGETNESRNKEAEGGMKASQYPSVGGFALLAGLNLELLFRRNITIVSI
jgi:hypothetical protein